MGCAETLILPSFLENCPYVVLEAMASGLPVIASNVGGIFEIIKDDNYGLTFTSGSSIELSRKVIELLQDRSLRRKLSQNGRKLVADRFSWASNLKMQMHAYESVLS
jgi:glycosyltransferase involved in cell wall biosynthesis